MKPWFLRWHSFPASANILGNSLQSASAKRPHKCQKPKKHNLGWAGTHKTTLFTERPFQQMCLKMMSNKTTESLIFDSLSSFVWHLAGPCRPEPKKQDLLCHLTAKIMKLMYLIAISYVICGSFFHAWWAKLGGVAMPRRRRLRYSPNKDFSQGRGSYFFSIVIPLESRIAGRRPRYLSLGT